MIKLFNLDLHISVIADVEYILKDIYGDKIDITNFSISGHNWVFNKPTANVKYVNQHTWKHINEEMIENFTEHYKDYLSQFDGFLVTHTPVFALLYEKCNKPIIIVNSCRYEQPYSWNNDIKGWDWLNTKLKNMKNVHFISNNKADQSYLKMCTGIDSIHIPSLCLYTKQTYNRKNDTIVQHGHVHGRYTWEWLYSNKAIIHVPYEVSTMSIFEQYSANIPLLFPSKRLLKHMNSLKSIYGELHPKLSVCRDIEWWINRADYYDEDNMKHIILFDDQEDLVRKINETDFDNISKMMKEHNVTRKCKVYQQWKDVIDRIFFEHL